MTVDFLVVVALEEEREHILRLLESRKKLPPLLDDVHVYYEASLRASRDDGCSGTYRLIVVQLLGMGRPQAAASVTSAVTKWRPNYVLLVGVAGGIEAKGVVLGDLLVANEVIDYEQQKIGKDDPQYRWQAYQADPRLLAAVQNLPAKSWSRLVRCSRPRGARSSARRHVGPVASGDKVAALASFIDRLREHWPALLGIEMEASGVAMACRQFARSPGFLMVRGVSDLADERKNLGATERWRSYAGSVAAAYAVALLMSMPVPCLDREFERLRRELIEGSPCALSALQDEAEKLRTEFPSDHAVRDLCSQIAQRIREASISAGGPGGSLL